MERSSSSSSSSLQKRKPRLPPTPDTEVVALSPESLTAASRYFCDICRKGFQREQNLQLHRRSHNLPWDLKQRPAAGKEPPAMRVYVCPVPTCVHHDPSKALGDLSGIKKHFSRKHGEKKFACRTCGKKYAVQCDLRAHVKVCGTKTHRCDCGALFTKQDNLSRHKEYCAAIAQVIARHQPPPPPSLTLSMGEPSPSRVPVTVSSGGQSSVVPTEFHGSQSGYSQWKEETLPLSTMAVTQSLLSNSMSFCSDVLLPPIEPTSLLSFMSPPQYVAAASPSPPVLSATALLQKAAQIGSTYSTGGSFLHGFGFSMTSGFNPLNNALPAAPMKWNGLPDSMVDQPSPTMIFGNQLQTLDFLGVGNGNDNDNGDENVSLFGKPGWGEYLWGNSTNHL